MYDQTRTRELVKACKNYTDNRFDHLWSDICAIRANFTRWGEFFENDNCAIKNLDSLLFIPHDFSGELQLVFRKHPENNTSSLEEVLKSKAAYIGSNSDQQTEKNNVVLLHKADEKKQEIIHVEIDRKNCNEDAKEDDEQGAWPAGLLWMEN